MSQVRPALWLADAAAAWTQLQPADPTTRAAIAGLLGLGLPGTAAESEPNPLPSPEPARASAVPQAGPVPQMPTAATGDDPADGKDLDRPPAPDPTPALLVALPAPALARPCPWQREPALARPTASPGLASAPTPLFRPAVARGVVQLVVQTPIPDGQPLLAEAVRRIARGEALDRMPEARRGSLLRGVQLLIDLGDGMDPYAADQAQLADLIRGVVGAERMRQLAFRDCPTEGAGAGPVWDWTPYRPPPPGTAVVLLTDLGIRRAAGESRGAPAAAWLAFVADLHRAGCGALALVPYPPGRWPAALRPVLDILTWDHWTTTSRLRKWIRHRPPGLPR